MLKRILLVSVIAAAVIFLPNAIVEYFFPHIYYRETKFFVWVHGLFFLSLSAWVVLSMGWLIAKAYFYIKYNEWNND